MRDSKFQNAYKIFTKALETLNILSDHTQYAKYSTKGNSDTICFWVNFLKWAKILYLPKSETGEKIEQMLKVVDPGNEYFREEEAAFEMFDQAIAE